MIVINLLHEYAAAKTGEYLVILCNTQNFQIPTYNTV